jgi:hypothetical protein
MSGCRRNWLPFTLIAYITAAVFHPRNFAVSNYNYESLRAFEKQISTSLEPHTNETTDDLRPLCPVLPEFGYKSITSIQQNGSFWGLDDIEDFDDKITAQSLNLEIGGIWAPKTCNPVHHVSLIVPYRDRPVQLRKFLLYIHKFLQLQLVHYKIIVVEQTDEEPFNRGKLLNVGFTEAIKQGWFHCFIFHDVDLLPGELAFKCLLIHTVIITYNMQHFPHNNRNCFSFLLESLYNVYGCTQRPRHLSAACNKFR